MLSDILNNFSTDELKKFLNKEALDFAIQFSNKDLSEEDSLYTKSDIIKIIVNTLQGEFVYNDSFRVKLIDRMTKSQLHKLFPDFDVEESTLGSVHYDAVTNWAKACPRNFAERLGLSETYDTQTEQVDISQLESIAHVEPNFALYPYQFDITQRTFSSFSSGKKRVLIHLPTGAGKTRTAMNIACEHLRSSKKNVVLWLADREELCTQAYNEFKNAWRSLGNYSTSLYGFYSGSAQSLSGIDSGFLVAGLQKFLSIREHNSSQLQLLYKELASSVTMVIFDEAHKSVAPRYKQVVEDFVSTEGFDALLIGLTATPGRTYSELGLTEEDALLADFFYNNKVSMHVPGYLSPVDYLVEQGYLAKANFKSLNYQNSAIAAFELVDSNTSQTMKALAQNKERNKVILDVITEECSKGSKVIVFACSVTHSINIATALAYHGINAASVDSANDSADSRRAKINRYKHGDLQVLVNFNVLTAGFDAPKTSVTVIAKPMNSLVQYLQMAGRAMRGTKSGGNKECHIYTVMDDIPEFRSVTKAFNYWNEMWASKEEV